ncbi:hypothetical protein DMP17_38375 [Pseudonocardia sp. TMWB2A]|uniref:glycoside hydrolase family 16 protein n=1 Tax=Pseudonocardia sp. TMWB2A TaxID=687430 RepID=UPI00307DFFDC
MIQRRTFLLAGFNAALLTHMSCGSNRPLASVSGFADDFETLSTDLWTTGEPHTLARTEMLPTNVTVVDGKLHLNLPGGDLTGAELRSVAALPAGTCRARIKAADSPDSVTGFFLYAPPDFAHEVDIELYNRTAGHARLTTYAGGELTKTVEVDLPFDPVADFHDYAIATFPRGVEFYADGQLLGSWAAGVPIDPMNFYLNAWYPTWLGGVPAREATAVVVDSASFTPHQA